MSSVGTTTLGVGEADVVSDAGPQFFDGGNPVPVEVLLVEERPDALRAGMVEVTARCSHGSNRSDLLAELDDSLIGELAA